MSEALETLAAKINREHDAGDAKAAEGLAHYIRAGEHLIAAKQACGHGHFYKWMDDNIRVGRYAAQQWMRLARQKDELPDGIVNQQEAIGYLRALDKGVKGNAALAEGRRRREEMKARSRAFHERSAKALEREQRRQAAAKRGGSVGSAYSHLRLCIDDLSRAAADPKNEQVKFAIHRTIQSLYIAEDGMKDVLGADYGHARKGKAA